MSERGRELFDNYVTNTLNHPTLAALSPECHAENLVAMAKAASIPVQEISEEVGAIAEAFACVLMNERREIAHRTQRPEATG